MQGSCNDILGVFSDIKDVIKTLSSVRQKIEEKHAKWFQEACRISEKLDITVQKPRTCQVQRNRANNPACRNMHRRLLQEKSHHSVS